MPVVLLAVAALILCGVVAVALGRGGELVEFASDRPPFDPDLATAADVAMLRPPSALWGYSVQATDEAFNRIAQAVTERDVEIAALRRKLEELTSTPAADQAARTRQLPAAGQFPSAGQFPAHGQFQAPGHGSAGQVPASGWAEELRPAASSHLGEGLWPANPAAQGAPWPADPAPGAAGGARPSAFLSSMTGQPGASEQRGPRSAWERPLEPEPAAEQGFQPSPEPLEAGDDK